jgi:cobalamin synthase
VKDRTARLAGRAGLMATLLLLAAASPAAAQPSDIGKNLGDEVKAIATALLLGVATLVGLPALAQRKIGEIFAIAVCVLVLGMFIFAPSETKSVIKGFASSLSGGG